MILLEENHCLQQTAHHAHLPLAPKKKKTKEFNEFPTNEKMPLASSVPGAS